MIPRFRSFENFVIATDYDETCWNQKEETDTCLWQIDIQRTDGGRYSAIVFDVT